MRVLLIDQHFWPDMPGYFSWRIGQQLVADGHEVHVLTTQPSYNSNRRELRQPWLQDVDGMSVLRLPTAVRRRRTRRSQLLSALLLSAAAFFMLLVRRFDVARFGTVPPVMLGLAVVAATRCRPRGARLAYHCQDIYPEVLRPSAEEPGSLIWRLLRMLDTFVARSCDVVVTLSSDMVRTLEARGVGADRIVVINNPYAVEPADAAVREAHLPDLGQRPVIMFAGNLGRFQNLGVLVEAMHLLADESVQLCFVGEGAVKAHLQRLAGGLTGRSVHFLPFVPPEVAFAMLQHADVAVVSLASGVYRAAYPSKTMSALAAGCRLVVIAERESELVRTTLVHDLGSWAPPGDPAALAYALIREVRRSGPDRRRRTAAHARAFHGPAAVLPRWTALFERMVDGAPAAAQRVREAAA